MLNNKVLLKAVKKMTRCGLNSGVITVTNKAGIKLSTIRIIIKYAMLPRHRSGCLVTPARLYYVSDRELKKIIIDMRKLDELLAESDKHIPFLDTQQKQELKASLTTLIEKIDLTKKMLKMA